MNNYFDHENGAQLCEKVAATLKDASRCCTISFGRNILPTVSFDLASCGAAFSFSDGLMIERKNAGSTVYETEARALPFTEAQWKLNEAGANWGGSWGGHANPDFGRVVNLGTNGIRRIIDEHEKKNPKESAPFYRACRDVLDALDILGDRFRDLACELSESCSDPEDKERYEAAYRAFCTVPREPAYDFTSACHAFWLTFTFDGIDSPGRFDQYMKRAYEASDRDEARDVLERLWECFHDTRTWNLCVGGSDEEWRDETNGLTYDILKIAREKKYQTPNLTLRVHRNTPGELWDALTKTLATGIGMPALYNDEVVCPALEALGIPAHDSHDYCLNGCNQIDIMGKSHMGLEDGEVSLGKCLEYALHNGKNALTGNADSIESGDAASFESFDELLAAFYAQVDHVTYNACLSANAAQMTRALFQPNPFRSCLIEGCLEKGRDYRNGGPLYGHGQILLEAIADTADSLWAVKRLVYDEKKYDMKQLIEALDDDFVGHDELFLDFSRCEKFGNDHDCVDDIASGIVSHFTSFVKRIRTYRGGVYTGGCSPFDRAASYGRRIGALPNGKRRGEPLIADSIAARPGCDRLGPTAHINSVLKYDHSDCGSGFVFQLKFAKDVFSSEKGMESFKALAKSYFSKGGQQLAVNVLSREDLLDAKVHPERHGDLIVRVGGYSDYFNNLEEGLKDNVIARTFEEL